MSGSVSEKIRAALTAATAAPSLFNTQPWRLRTAGRMVLVCADASRRLPVHDPLDRELLMSCGTFSLFAEVALRAQGLRYDVEDLPDPAHAPDVAVVLRPRAEDCAVDGEAARLAAAMNRTPYDRRPFLSQPVPAAERDALRIAAEAEGVWLLPFDEDRRIQAAVLHTSADEMLRADQQAMAEVALWSQIGENAVDGVPTDAVDRHSDERACSLALRDFDTSPHQPRSPGQPLEPEHPAIALLCTTHDRPEDWIIAGRALGRVLLEAASAGLATSPLNQSLQTGLRWRLPSALSLTGVPQYLLRLGFPASSPPPHRPRRPLPELLNLASSAAAHGYLTPATTLSPGFSRAHKETA